MEDARHQVLSKKTKIDGNIYILFSSRSKQITRSWHFNNQSWILNSIFFSFLYEVEVFDSDRDRLKILKLFILQQKPICGPLQNNNKELVLSEFMLWTIFNLTKLIISQVRILFKETRPLELISEGSLKALKAVTYYGNCAANVK